MSKSTIFKNLLEQNNIYMEENRDEIGTFFRAPQSLKSGGNVLVVVSFSNQESIVDISIFNIAQIENPLKKEELNKLINELNKDYRYAKFIESDNSVIAQYSYDVREHFNPGLVLDHVALLLNVVDDAYPKFMKLQWA